MSDFDISGSDSEPVSDINPDEMDKLMADLGDFDDDDIFKSSKSTAKTQPSSKKEEVKDTGRRVKFNEKKAAKEDEDDDWDADDLLQSDEDRPVKKTQKSSSSGKPVKSASPVKKESQDEERSNQRNKAKSKLMADLFSDDGKEETPKNKSPAPGSGRKDKSKLMAELFGNEDSSPTKAETGERKTSGDSRTKPPPRKAKDEVTFDDDDDDLLGGLGDTKKRVSDSPKSSSFLDSLLSKSTTSERPTGERKKSTEFVLDEKYKNTRKEKKEEQDSFGGYMPSAGKSDSPRRRTPKKSPANDPFDLFGDSEPRRRNPGSATRRKKFEIDDDDILGNIKSQKTPTKEQATKNEGEKNVRTPTRQSSGQSKGSRGGKDDWLFGGSGEGADTTTKNMETSRVIESEGQTHETHGRAEKPSSTPDKSQDWLGSLLSADKKSPVLSKQGVSTSNSPTVMPTPSPQLQPEPKSLPVNETTHEPTFAPKPSISTNIQQSAADAQLLLLKRQEESQAQAALQLKAQQQLESQMALQMQQQQQNMADAMAQQQQAMMKRYQEMMSSMGQMALPPLHPAEKDASKDDDQQKELQVELQSAKIEVARLEAELELIRKQHSEEVSLLEEAHLRKINVEREVWEQIEKRLREERDGAVIDLQSKLSALRLEKESLASSYETQLESVKHEWSQALERTKELYVGIMERMKEEHKMGLQRMTDLKEMELKAAVSASGHVREVEVVMNQLESNASNLSEITAIINSRQDGALELTHRALQIKEKQLKDFEAQLSASRTESESERGRLNALIHRLENTLVQQGSEVEKDKWKLAQERMKIEIERQAMTEERRHLQLSLETERQNLSSVRESLMTEHRTVLQNVAKQKQELETQRAQFSAQQRFSQLYSLHNVPETTISSNVDAELVILNDEQRRLKEKMMSVDHLEQEVKVEKERLDELSFELEQEKVKVAMERETVHQEQKVLNRRAEEIENSRSEIQTLVQGQQARLSQITTQTASLHAAQERLDKEQKRLEHLKEEAMHSIQLGLCAACQNQGGTSYAMDYLSRNSTIGRLPGDGGEVHTNIKMEKTNSASLAPSSVLARLAAARERENLERERKLMQISAMESS